MGQRTTLNRRKRVHAQGAAPLQKFDEKQAALNAIQKGQAVAQSNVDRLTPLKRFRKLIAPFSDVDTARSIDVDALLSPTTGTGARPLLALARVDIV